MIDEKRTAYRFFSKQHPEISSFLKLFYRNGRKVIPKAFELDPVALTVWFMDDGSKCRKHDVYLNCQQFALKDQNALLLALRKMGLSARLNRDKKYYRIRFLKDSIPKLNQIMIPFIVPAMRYKLSYDPVETYPEKDGVRQIRRANTPTPNPARAGRVKI